MATRTHGGRGGGLTPSRGAELDLPTRSRLRPRQVQALAGKPVHATGPVCPTAKPTSSCGTAPACAPHRPRSSPSSTRAMIAGLAVAGTSKDQREGERRHVASVVVAAFLPERSL